MPPKRKVPARRASTGRPRRDAAAEMNYKLPALTTNASYNSPMNRAKITVEAQATPATKRRGRPPKNAAGETSATKKTAATPTKSPKKPAVPTTNVAASKIPGRRGRPPKIDPPAVEPKTTKRKREEIETVAAPAKKRGRPAATSTPAKDRKPIAVKAEKGAKAVRAAGTGAKRGPKPGTKRGAKAMTAVTKTSKTGRPKKTAAVTPANDDTIEDDMLETGDDQYWLMKAEPETRLENGIDVAFPIDKLAATTEPEPWDGVRNYVARNHMRAMRKGDLAFFYHSNTKTPAIVGVMRIVEEHSTDESAFDPSHPYFDEKSSRDKPKWDCVKVEFVKKFEEPITLKKVQATSDLSNMQLVQKAYGRLSVQKVRPSEWLQILKMAGEPEDVGVAEQKSGYEADTNGETDKEVVEESVGGEDEDVEAAKLAAYGLPEREPEKGDEHALPTPSDMLALEAATNGIAAVQD